MPCQDSRNGKGVGVHCLDPIREGCGVGEHHRSVEWEVGILEVLCEGAMEGRIEGGGRIQHHATTHDVAFAAEGFAEGGYDYISKGEDIDVYEGADGFVNY